jgi:hypothetical protein
MTFDFDKVWASKRRYRQRLAARPIAEKLAMLDALRQRQLAIRRLARPPERADTLAEPSVPYKTKPE